MSKKPSISSAAKDIIIVVIGIAIIWVGLRVAFGTDNPFYVVSSGSMEPNLKVFDVLVVQGNDPFEKIQKGDIIVFNRPAGHDRVIVHRVAEILDESPRVLRTRGDANPASIPGTDFPITKQEYIGKVAYVVPQIGYITRILTPPINYIIIAVIVGIMIFKQFGKTKTKTESVTVSDPSSQDSSAAGITDPKNEIEQTSDKETLKNDNITENFDSKDSEQKEN